MAGRLSLIFYRLIWNLLSFIVPALLLWRSHKGKEDSTRLNERYGMASLKRPQNIDKLFWLHGVSVGESVSSLVLAMALLKLSPKSHILITSNTITSQHMLRERINDLGLENKISVQTHPYDKSKWIKRFLDHWKPDAAVMMESEIWPNMITLSHEHNIPVMMASAQISNKSLRRWTGVAKPLAGPIFNAISKIIAIDETQVAHFNALITKDKTAIGGSMKAAAPRLPVKHDLVKDIIDGAAGRNIILLASSHETEEVLFIEAMEAINQTGAFMGIIAPRHVMRGDSIENLILNAGMTTSRRSKGDFPDQTTKIWIADAMGEMGSLIEAADLIVLGGGFSPLGGHNPMEMAALGKGVLSGPNVFKNNTIFDLLKENKGCLIVKTASELADNLTMLAASSTQLQALNNGAVLSYNMLTDAADKTARIMIDEVERFEGMRHE